jgi:methionyl aminopeptidase
VGVGRAKPATNRLAATARHALTEALRVARAGAPQSVIGAAIERETGARGYAVCAELMGHGIGRHLHEAPDVPSVYVPGLTDTLTDGLVLTIEPIVSTGTGEVRPGADGWTVRTADGALSAHEEHTIVIIPAAPLVLTA